MATTPNYGWVTPAPTDFVTDLPADFETFADAVDGDLAGLLGGTTGQVLTKDSNDDHDFSWQAAGLSASIFDAKGDLIAATAADTASRLAIGTNGQVLTADSAEATGMKWAAPAASGMGGLTLLNTGDTSVGTGTSKTWTGLTTYQNYILRIDSVKGNSGTPSFRLEASDGTTTVFWGFSGYAIVNYSSYTQSSFVISEGGGTDLSIGSASTDGSIGGFVWLPNANANGKKYAKIICGNKRGSDQAVARISDAYETTSSTNEITQLTIALNTGNFSGGNVYIYGA